MKVLFKTSQNKSISHKEILDLFDIDQDKIKLQGENGEENPLAGHIPQLDPHQLLSLKIAYNLKELTYQKNVKDFFFSRFKRKLIKQDFIEKIQYKIVKYIMETEVMLRASQNKLYALFYYLVSTKTFKSITFLLIVANTVVLALNRDTHLLSSKDDDFQENIIELINLFFFAFFCFEIIAKLIGQGYKHYFKDRYNWFDSIVIILSAVDIIVGLTFKFTADSTSGEKAKSGALTALRVLRLIRIFQLAKVWRDFQELLSVILGTLQDVANISILILLLLYCFQLIGMELYAFKLPATNDETLFYYYHEPNFDTFLDAFVSVFIVLANDGWFRLYMNHYRATNTPLGSSFYFFSLLILGQFILLNLFISVLINNFEETSVKNDLVTRLTNLKKDSMWKKIKMWIQSKLQLFKKLLGSPAKDNISQDGLKSSKIIDEGEKKIDDMLDEKYQRELMRKDQLKFESPTYFIFKYESLMRQLCLRIVMHPDFEIFMGVFTLISSVQLAVDNPLNDPDSKFSRVILIVDYVLTTIFGLEFIIKSIALGVFLTGERSYVRNISNILDFSLIIITVASYLVQSNLNSIKALKLLKLLRPLRAISVNQNLKIAVKALSLAIAEIVEVIFVLMIFLFIFGTICVNYFKGQFYICDYKEGQISLNRLMNVRDKWECLNLGQDWKNSYFNFDDIVQSMCNLFIISNSISWSEIMHQASKTRGYDQTPDYYADLQTIPALFFVLILIIGNFFFMNIFIGVIVAKYNREKELAGKNHLLTDEQKKWMKNRMNIIYAQPKYKMEMPKAEWRQPFYYIVDNIYFQNFVNLCLVINTLTLAIQWYGMPEKLSQSFDSLNFTLTIIFTLELTMKIAGYSTRFFLDPWNIFDMIIVILTLLGIIISSMVNSSFGPQTTIIRSFRILRIFLFFKRNQGLKTTLMSFLMSIPGIVNIGGLLLLINLIFSILGMYLFADVMPNGQLNEYNHFRTFGTSFLTLIRTITGEKWPSLMEALSRKSSPSYQCMQDPSYEDYVLNKNVALGCGSELKAKIFFFSFTIMMSTVFMKLFIALIWQTFFQMSERDNKFMSSDLILNFRETWSNFDAQATSFIKVNSYPQFLVHLGEPLGWNVSFQHNFMKRLAYLAEISLPKHNSATEYYFLDVFEHLILLMIIRREIINYAIKTRHFELLGVVNEKMYYGFDDLIYQLRNQREDKLMDSIKINIIKTNSHRTQEYLKSNDDQLMVFPTQVQIIEEQKQEKTFQPVQRFNQMSDLNIANQLSIDEGLNSGSTTQPPPTGNGGEVRYVMSPPIPGVAAAVLSNRHTLKNTSSSSSIWEDNIDENSAAPTIQPKIIVNQYENSPKNNSYSTGEQYVEPEKSEPQIESAKTENDLLRLQNGSVIKDVSQLIQDTVSVYLRNNPIKGLTSATLLQMLGLDISLLAQQPNNVRQQQDREYDVLKSTQQKISQNDKKKTLLSKGQQIDNYEDIIQEELNRELYMSEEEINSMRSYELLPYQSPIDRLNAEQFAHNIKINTQQESLIYIEQQMEKIGSQQNKLKPQQSRPLTKQEKYTEAQDTIKNLLQIASFRGPGKKVQVSKPSPSAYGKRPHQD